MHNIPSSTETSAHILYEKYAGILFAVLLNRCETRQDAEKVLCLTFQNISRQSLAVPSFIAITKLAVATAMKHVKLREHAACNELKAKPMLHHLICEGGSVQTLCEKSGLQRGEIAKMLHDEMQATSYQPNNFQST